MKRFPFKLPAWITLLPGMLCGAYWIVESQSPLPPDLPANVEPRRFRPKAQNHLDTKDQNDRIVSDFKSRRIRLTLDQIRLLKNAKGSLNFNLTRFGPGANLELNDIAFEILRQILDLTPTEETALRTNFEMAAEHLREYEIANCKNLTSSKNKLSFDLPVSGEFHEQFREEFLLQQRDLLGEKRAELLAIVTQLERFNDYKPAFDGHIEMTSNSDWGFYQFSDQRLSSKVPDSDTQKESIRRKVFGRYFHLIPPNAQFKFLGIDPPPP